MSVCLWVIHTFMLKCVLQYFDTFCLKSSENFNWFHFSHTIRYTSLHFNITNLPLTYHIRVSSIEFYGHRITLSISGKCFVPHNQIILCSFNIGTASHLLSPKSPRSDLQEWFDKVLYNLEFIQFHPIVILIWNAWFGWIHTI